MELTQSHVAGGPLRAEGTVQTDEDAAKQGNAAGRPLPQADCLTEKLGHRGREHSCQPARGQSGQTCCNNSAAQPSLPRGWLQGVREPWSAMKPAEQHTSMPGRIMRPCKCISERCVLSTQTKQSFHDYVRRCPESHLSRKAPLLAGVCWKAVMVAALPRNVHRPSSAPAHKGLPVSRGSPR